MSLSTVRRRWEGSFQEGGKLHGLPYIPLSKMRNTHTTLYQEAGMNAEDDVELGERGVPGTAEAG
jgi:hypothetical protein